jgi:hypothetical protein
MPLWFIILEFELKRGLISESCSTSKLLSTTLSLLVEDKVPSLRVVAANFYYLIADPSLDSFLALDSSFYFKVSDSKLYFGCFLAELSLCFYRYCSLLYRSMRIS